MSFDVAVIGVGPGREVDISGRAHSWAYHHADAYADRSDCSIVAAVDLVEEYAAAFAAEFDVPDDGIFTDHREMLTAVDPDVVSVVTPIPTHAPLVIDCARAGVAAVHCEKPMARTWAEARAMYHECDHAGTQLTIAHQRRFAEQVVEANRLLDAGEIGALERVETSWGNFFDNGTHPIDVAGKLVDEARAAWVIGQIDYTIDHVRYGVPHAQHAFMSWQYENGIHGISATGDAALLPGDGPYDFDIYDGFLQLIGTAGELQILESAPGLRLRQDGADWSAIEVDPELLELVDQGVDAAVDALATGEPTELRAANALNTAEILFAGHESARRRGRVDLPLSGVYDHPLETLLASGELEPTIPDDRPPHPADERSTDG